MDEEDQEGHEKLECTTAPHTRHYVKLALYTNIYSKKHIFYSFSGLMMG